MIKNKRTGGAYTDTDIQTYKDRDSETNKHTANTYRYIAWIITTMINLPILQTYKENLPKSKKKTKFPENNFQEKKDCKTSIANIQALKKYIT